MTILRYISSNIVYLWIIVIKTLIINDFIIIKSTVIERVLLFGYILKNVKFIIVIISLTLNKFEYKLYFDCGYIIPFINKEFLLKILPIIDNKFILTKLNYKSLKNTKYVIFE